MVVHASMKGAMFNHVGRDTGVHRRISVRGLARDVKEQYLLSVLRCPRCQKIVPSVNVSHRIEIHLLL